MKTKLLALLFLFTVTFSFSQTQTVTITWNFFSIPDSDEDSVVNTDITIEEGDTVKWIWEGLSGHNVKSVPRLGGIIDSGGDDSTTFNAPYEYSVVFNDIGSYDFECAPHAAIMYGTITVVAEGTLSINDFEKVDFSIYPNPSKSKLNISLAHDSNDTKVEVFDVLGKRIYVKALTEMKSAINASSWNSGVYLVKITNDTGTQTKRFVKQ